MYPAMWQNLSFMDACFNLTMPTNVVDRVVITACKEIGAEHNYSGQVYCQLKG